MSAYPKKVANALYFFPSSMAFRKPSSFLNTFTASKSSPLGQKFCVSYDELKGNQIELLFYEFLILLNSQFTDCNTHRILGIIND